MCASEKPKKLFVIVDAFLDRSQQAVQACHAVAKFCIEEQGLAIGLWNNQNIVLKKAKDLEPWVGDADVIFEEPYWKNRRTAVASYRHEGYAEVLPFV